ncbi:unnamed protein product [Caenorhabditis nigoni]
MSNVVVPPELRRIAPQLISNRQANFRLGNLVKQHNDQQLNFSEQVINSQLLATNKGTKNIYRRVQAATDKKLAEDNVDNLQIVSSPAVEEETRSRVSSIHPRTPKVSRHFKEISTTKSHLSLQRQAVMSSPEVECQHRSFSERSRSKGSVKSFAPDVTAEDLNAIIRNDDQISWRIPVPMKLIVMSF